HIRVDGAVVALSFGSGKISGTVCGEVADGSACAGIAIGATSRERKHKAALQATSVAISSTSVRERGGHGQQPENNHRCYAVHKLHGTSSLIVCRWVSFNQKPRKDAHGDMVRVQAEQILAIRHLFPRARC